MKKRVLSILTVAAMLLTSLPSAALALGDRSSESYDSTGTILADDTYTLGADVPSLPLTVELSAPEADGANALEVNTVTAGAFTLTSDSALVSGEDYSYADNTLTIMSSKPITISTDETTNDYIVIASDITANVVLDNVRINREFEQLCTSAINILGDSTLNLTLKNDNFLIGTTAVTASAALHVAGTSTLVITDESLGTLEARGGTSTKDDGAAAIGGNAGESSGTIQILGGTVKAYGGVGYYYGAAGIGSSGKFANGSYPNGNIKIQNAYVMAQGGNSRRGYPAGAAIGGGGLAAAGQIEISSSTIEILGGAYPLIGSGEEAGPSSNTTIDNSILYLMRSDATQSAQVSNSVPFIYDKAPDVFNAVAVGNPTIAGHIKPNARLTIPTDTTLTVADGKTLDVNGAITNQGTLNASGTLNVDGAITSSGTLKVPGTLNLEDSKSLLDLSGSLDVNTLIRTGTLLLRDGITGTITQTSGSGDIIADSNATIAIAGVAAEDITRCRILGALILPAGTEDTISYDDEANILSINGNGSIELRSTYFRAASDIAIRISDCVTESVELVLNGLNLTNKGRTDALSPITVPDSGVTVLLLLKDGSINQMTSVLGNIPAIQKGQDNSTLSISCESAEGKAHNCASNGTCGQLIAKSVASTHAPAIGGRSKTSNISIQGGILSAHGGDWSAAIGVGFDAKKGYCKNIRINGGFLNLSAGNPDANFIGTGTENKDEPDVKLDGGTIVVNSGQFVQAGGSSSGAAIVYGDCNPPSGFNGIVVKNAEITARGKTLLDRNFTIPGASALTVPEGASLTIVEGNTLTIDPNAKLVNNSTISNFGKIVNHGTFTNFGVLKNYGIVSGNTVGGGGSVLDTESTIAVTLPKGNIATYGDTITITATVGEKPAANTLTRNAAVNTVDFYCGTVDTGTKLNTSLVSVIGNTATLDVRLDGTMWIPSDTPYTITADFGGSTGSPGLLANIGTAQLIVNKANQVAPAPSQSSATASSITLNTVSDTGHGDLKYGYQAASESSPGHWQTSPSFLGLNAATAYTFFTRFKGDSYYNPAVSTNGTKLYTLPATPTGTTGYTIQYAAETATAASGHEISTNSGGAWSDSAISVTPDSSFLVRVKATAGGAPASETQTVNVPQRPDAPSGLLGINETFDGQNDGQITVTSTLMEYKSAAGTWTVCPGATLTALAPGTYSVRLKAVTDGIKAFAGAVATVTIATGAERTYTLNVAAPGFAPVTVGYAQPSAKAITIASTGNSDATISGVALSGTDSSSFTLNKTDGTTITAGSTDSATYTVRPNSGLAVGNYTATITVAYNSGATATATVTFTVIPTIFHTVTFDSQGGSAVAITTVTDGGKVERPTDPIRSSYAFGGWYKEAACINAWDFTSDTVSASMSLYAKWMQNSSGGDYTPSNPPTVVTPPATAEQPNPPTQATITVPGTPDKDGNVNVTIPDRNISDAIRAAKKQAGQNGISVTIKVNITQTANSLVVTLSKAALDKLVTEGVKELKIESTLISFSFNLDALKEIQKSVTGNLIIAAKKLDGKKLSATAQKIIGGRPVFDFTMQSGGKSISDFGKGGASVWIPYTPAQDETEDSLQVVYVDGKGAVEWIADSSYSKEAKALQFFTGHFSTYGVGYQSVAAFADTVNHWAKDDIAFVAARNLLLGTSATTFSPDTAMTRGMFVTALGRLAEIDSTKYKNSKFNDVTATAYYAPYVAWAAQNGIVNGTSATTFAPDDGITRQEMALLMQNYTKAMGYTLPNPRPAVIFADSGSIRSWAVDAVRAMQMAGIIWGKDGNRFDPTGTATRAEAAVVLRRYVELVVDPTMK